MPHVDSSPVDRFILRCCRVVDISVHSGHSTKPTGHLQLLSRKYLSDRRRPESIQYFEFPPGFPTPIFSTKLCRLGERTLVLELDDRSYLCSARDVATAVGTKIHSARYSPPERARIRAFFFEGVEKFLLPWVVEALPTLLHVSLFLFFAGLVVFICNVNLTIFKLVLSWVGVCTALYGCATFVPIFCHDSPYYTPLTSLVRPIVIGIPYVIYGVLRWFTWSVYFHDGALHHFRGLEDSYRKLLVQGMQKTAEETAQDSPSEIDTRAFVWTFDRLDEDH